MSVPFNPPPPISVLPDDLKKQAKARIERNLSQLVKRLSGTVFYSDSPALNCLKSSLGQTEPGLPVDVSDTDEQICEKFIRNVPFTSYDDYQPYVSRLLEENCRASEIEHLLAPGLPDFVANTSGTSGTVIKYFPKYHNPLYSNRPRWNSAEAQQSVKYVQFGSLSAKRFIPVTGRDGENLPGIPQTIVSSGGSRMYFGIRPEDDADTVTKKASFMTSPWAAWYLPTYICIIHTHSFFAILDKSPVFMVANLPTMITDSISAIRAQWTNWIEAIATGILPDFPNLPEERRQQLQAHLTPNLVRAAELRIIDISKEGWLKEVWPALAMIRIPLSGPYAMTIPRIRYHFGTTVVLQSAVYGATESVVAFGYDSMNLNLYRLNSDGHIELLDIEKAHNIANISQPWEVEVGKRYEVLCTNQDGLWRYTLEDIVEVVGFSPTDGQPLIKYIERKGVGFRVWIEFVCEEQLRGAVKAAESVLCSVVEFTVVLDERDAGRAYGFLLELDGEPGPDAHLARSKLQEHLYSNKGYKHYSEAGNIGYPTIRILAPGTFCAYRERKINLTGSTVGQTKVPCFVSDLETMEWLSTKVEKELQ